MTKEKYIKLTGGLLAGVVLCFAWSTALTLLLRHPLTSMEPWAVFSFMSQYGFSGQAGTLLFRSLLMAFATAVLLATAFLLIKRPAWYGDARWATAWEIGRVRLQKKRGLVLGKKGGKYLINDEPLHTLVAAPTRSGKGVGIVIPNLLAWDGSLVVLDIKKENYQRTAGYRAEHQQVYMWSPMDARSACYNPFDFITPEGPQRITDMQLLATILLPAPPRSDPMWINEARDLFLGIALLVLDDPDVPSTLGQVYRTLKQETDLAEAAKIVLDQTAFPLDPICRLALANFKNKADKERSGVKSTLTAALNLWANPVIDAATSASDFDLRTFRQQRASVFVGVAQDQLVTLAPLLNLFFQQAVATLSHALPGKDEIHDVLFMIDEFPMLGQMESLAKGLALLAGYKIRIVLITQSLGQLKEIYGAGGQESILQNCAVQVFFASNDDSTTKYVSDRLGTKTIPIKSRSQAQAWKTTTSTSYVGRPLMSPEEVRRLDPGKAILFKESARPLLAQKIRYYTDRLFTRRLLDPPPVPVLKMPTPPLGRAERAALELAEMIQRRPPPQAPRDTPPAAELEAIYASFGAGRPAA